MRNEIIRNNSIRVIYNEDYDDTFQHDMTVQREKMNLLGVTDNIATMTVPVPAGAVPS